MLRNTEDAAPFCSVLLRTVLSYLIPSDQLGRSQFNSVQQCTYQQPELVCLRPEELPRRNSLRIELRVGSLVLPITDFLRFLKAIFVRCMLRLVGALRRERVVEIDYYLFSMLFAIVMTV